MNEEYSTIDLRDFIKCRQAFIVEIGNGETCLVPIPDTMKRVIAQDLMDHLTNVMTAASDNIGVLIEPLDAGDHAADDGQRESGADDRSRQDPGHDPEQDHYGDDARDREDILELDVETFGDPMKAALVGGYSHPTGDPFGMTPIVAPQAPAPMDADHPLATDASRADVTPSHAVDNPASADQDEAEPLPTLDSLDLAEDEDDEEELLLIEAKSALKS